MQLSCETDSQPLSCIANKSLFLTLLAIIIASVLGGVASCTVAAFALFAKLSSVERWVAFAVGAMLAVVFLDILPHALSEGVKPASLMGWVLGGILFFFFTKNS